MKRILKTSIVYSTMTILTFLLYGCEYWERVKASYTWKNMLYGATMAIVVGGLAGAYSLKKDKKKDNNDSEK